MYELFVFYVAGHAKFMFADIASANQAFRSAAQNPDVMGAWLYHNGEYDSQYVRAQ